MTKKYIPAPYEAARARSVSLLRMGWIILVLSLATHFVFFSHPPETVFDEVHFGKFVSGYFTGEYYFDIHPPLGKLLIAGVAKITDFKPGFSFETIGQKFSDDSYKWLRFLPKLAGTLLPIVIFLIAFQIGISQKFAFLAGILIVFENSLLVQSRFILLDSFLLLFGFLGILFFLKAKAYRLSPKFLFLSGFFAALAASIKWTGLGFLALMGLFYFINLLKSPVVEPRRLGSLRGTAEKKLKLALKGLVFLIVIPFMIYFLIFAVHFTFLDKPGPGSAFHPPNFQEDNILKKFVELNTELYASNARLTATHPYSSEWYEWPLMIRSVFYWQGDNERIYLLGNPLIYWLSTIAVIYFLINTFKKLKSLSSSHSLLVLSYLLNLLPFIFIGRVMFLYHYFISLIFAVLILCFQLDKLKNKKVFNAVLIGSIVLFLFFSPLTYGFEIPDWYHKMTVWLPSWR